ncbi:hypothetical protein NUW54_g10232 [Trametes sanguinea]|uniref:Uncharacterized protein n=1 Tax=Trametes sanguinea TaxID=158606 RepID=A0ACC1P0I0_9APHY|nr:hypothetical protein NUW54_g10232 [Trametes sanguinea]
MQPSSRCLRRLLSPESALRATRLVATERHAVDLPMDFGVVSSIEWAMMSAQYYARPACSRKIAGYRILANPTGPTFPPGPAIESGTERVEDLLVDGLHLSEKGYKIVYDGIISTIAEKYPEYHFDNLQTVFATYEPFFENPGDYLNITKKRSAFKN